MDAVHIPAIAGWMTKHDAHSHIFGTAWHRRFFSLSATGILSYTTNPGDRCEKSKSMNMVLQPPSPRHAGTPTPLVPDGVQRGALGSRLSLEDRKRENCSRRREAGAIVPRPCVHMLLWFGAWSRRMASGIERRHFDKTMAFGLCECSTLRSEYESFLYYRIKTYARIINWSPILKPDLANIVLLFRLDFVYLVQLQDHRKSRNSIVNNLILITTLQSCRSRVQACLLW